ncbi:MAG: BtpA/SgcQ family protein [Planctomycetes bacterium]|nr:BtpA/SgcQ family protein [Planctomycetota bacterium]MCB9888954.1 BtpA/SgcQ family protein [Planctomycetota bacterium]
MGKTLLGVVHLGALPSAAGCCEFEDVATAALRDAEALVAGGVDGVMVENFGDAPFHKGTRDDPVPPDVIAGLAVVAARIRGALQVDVAVNCLRNDAVAALGVAAVVGARWIRVNVLTGAYITDQGLVDGDAARLRAYRNQMQCGVRILADFLVKHAVPLGGVDPAVAARDLAERSGASGLVLSGRRTGEPVDEGLVDEVRAAVGAFPIWLGSGLTAQNADRLWSRCDGAIVATALQTGGRIDVGRVRELRAALRG